MLKTFGPHFHLWYSHFATLLELLGGLFVQDTLRVFARRPMLGFVTCEGTGSDSEELYITGCTLRARGVVESVVTKLGNGHFIGRSDR